MLTRNSELCYLQGNSFLFRFLHFRSQLHVGLLDSVLLVDFIVHVSLEFEVFFPLALARFFCFSNLFQVEEPLIKHVPSQEQGLNSPFFEIRSSRDARCLWRPRPYVAAALILRPVTFGCYTWCLSRFSLNIAGFAGMIDYCYRDLYQNILQIINIGIYN